MTGEDGVANELHSVVVPFLNEEAVLPEFIERITAAMREVGDYEVVFVDDGSTDGGVAIVAAAIARDPRLRLVRLGRDFGQMVALTAGIDFAVGDTVTVIDADLQDPPEMIPELIARWRDGADVVYTVRDSRAGETGFKKWTAAAFYRVLRRMTAYPIPVDASDFRLVSRRVADGLRGMREQNRYLRGMTAWFGLRQDCVRYHRDPRAAGETKYSLSKLLRLATDGIVSSSTRPLHAAMWLGFVAAGVGFAYGVYAIAYRVLADRPVEGWTSLMVALLFFSGVQLITVGIIGDYVGRIYDDVRGRPIYTVSEVLGFPEEIAASVRERGASGRSGVRDGR